MVDETVGHRRYRRRGLRNTEESYCCWRHHLAISTQELRQSPTTNISNALAGRFTRIDCQPIFRGRAGWSTRAPCLYAVCLPLETRTRLFWWMVSKEEFQYLNPEEVESFTIPERCLRYSRLRCQRCQRGLSWLQREEVKRWKGPMLPSRPQQVSPRPVKFPEYLGSADLCHALQRSEFK